MENSVVELDRYMYLAQRGLLSRDFPKNLNSGASWKLQIWFSFDLISTTKDHTTLYDMENDQKLPETLQDHCDLLGHSHFHYFEHRETKYDDCHKSAWCCVFTEHCLRDYLFHACYQLLPGSPKRCCCFLEATSRNQS